MAYAAKITIPRVESDKNVKLQVYRSRNAEDINTISKIAELEPIIVVDQDIAAWRKINGKKCYIAVDSPDPNANTAGITYNGPAPNTLPVNEYEMNINFINLNPYTYINEVVLNPLELTHSEGAMYYYSVIGVIEETGNITHLSKVQGVIIKYIQTEDLKRQLWSCDDFQDSLEDEWNLVTTLEYNEANNKIEIGNINKQFAISKYGYPVVETVPQIPKDEVSVSVNSLVSNTFMVLEIQNPWKESNETYNYRKLKSYKIANTYGNMVGDFSVPTYQSPVHIPIEKVIIMMKENPASEDVIDINDESSQKFEIIRKDGIFYDAKKHKRLGHNRWSIPLEENKLSVFNEFSVQDKINIQISGVIGNKYVFDIYLVDVYQHISNPTHYVLNT